MSRGGGSYDESLLRDAPAATREQLQEGYNPDILNGPARHKSLHHPQPIQQTPSGAAPPIPPVPLRTGADLEQGNPVPGGNSSNAYSPLNEKLERGRKTPFWRTPGGLVVIAIIVIVILGAVIGGAVGGTVGKKSNNSTVTSSVATTKSGGGAGLGNSDTLSGGSTTAITISQIIPIPTESNGVAATPTDAGSRQSGFRGVATIIHHLSPTEPFNSFTTLAGQMAQT